MTKLSSRIWLAAVCLGLSLLTSVATAADEPYRPEEGKFPALEKANAYRGELVFLDHANRRGSIRVQTESNFFRNSPQPFAMLPYGIVRCHGTRPICGISRSARSSTSEPFFHQIPRPRPCP